MVLNKIFLTEQFKKKVLKYNVENNDIIKYLSDLEIDKIKKKHHVNLYFRLKRYLKILILKISGFLWIRKNDIVVQSRKLENVKRKYDKISGLYVNKYLDKKTTFVAEIHRKKIAELKGHYEKYYSKILYNFYEYENFKSVLEVGAGELTIIAELMNRIGDKNSSILKGALDISFQRLLEGKKLVESKNLNFDYIVRGDASKLPFLDNSFEVIYTSHCLEQVPNLFDKIVSECIRVSKKYVIFIEPSYEYGSTVTKDHIFRKGYPKIKNKLFKEDKYRIILREPMPVRSLVNGTEIIILKKNDDQIFHNNNNLLCCPKSKNLLQKNGDKLICKKQQIFYPIKFGIPLLESDDLNRI